jgi:hypothetical protein
MPFRRWLRRIPPSPDPEAILREQPFAPQVTLARIEPLAEAEAHSGRAFLASDAQGRRYKLRVCPNERRARALEANVTRLPQVFPRLLARRGRHLLIEFVEGDCPSDRKQLRPYARRLGRLYAEIHREGELRGLRGRLRTRFEALRQRAQLARQLRALRRHGAVEDALGRDVGAALAAWRRRYGTPVALEPHDAHKANFMIDTGDELRYVDEEGLGYTIRGFGLAKLLSDRTERPYSRGRREEWSEFLEGYAEVGDASFLTADYRDYVRVLELVRSIEFKLRREARLYKVDADLEELRELVARVKTAPGSADPSVAPARGRGAP